MSKLKKYEFCREFETQMITDTREVYIVADAYLKTYHYNYCSQIKSNFEIKQKM